MNILKVKLSIFEKRLAMQVIEQDNSLRGSTSNPIEFTASNGIVIATSNRPGIYSELNRVELRGESSINDLDITYSRFETTREAEDFAKKVNLALKEFIESTKENLYKNVLDSSGFILLPWCSLSFSDIKGGFIAQVENINIPEDALSTSLINDKDFDVTITGSTVKVTIPFRQEESLETIVKDKNATKEQLDLIKIEIIKLLSKEINYIPADYKSEYNNFEIVLR